MPARVRQLVPGGVYAVFDHVAGPQRRRLLATARSRRHPRRLRHHLHPRRHRAEAVARTEDRRPDLALEHPAQRPPRPLLQHPAGRAWGKDRFRARLRADLTELLGPDTRRPTVDAGVPTASELLRRSLEAWLRDPKAVAEARR
ncbi:hypothetical protein ACFQ3Z_04560 [Streptomyces nogalater]